ncbi:hypothetical protein VNO77_08673 [Canavalia gladiata]|uniref:Uncharacterized protein n=1 Tax=Canavalia gladiata TaxID=3824 RepID=A0AAN9QX40_CANGL
MDESFFWGSPDFSRGHWLRGREKTHPHFLKSRLVPIEDGGLSLLARGVVIHSIIPSQLVRIFGKDFIVGASSKRGALQELYVGRGSGSSDRSYNNLHSLPDSSSIQVDLKPKEDSPSISLKARKKPRMELKLMSTLFSA